MNLPEEFESRMKKILGGEYDNFVSAMEIGPVRALRVNTLKYSTENFEKDCDFDIEKLPFCHEGYIFSREHIGSHPFHHAGAVYVQEPAAMAALECTEIKPGMHILDVCASPGGKSTQAAAKLHGEGIIVSNEIDRTRCQVLAQNMERMGVRNFSVTNTDSASLGEFYHKQFDLVIVDAPCSGEGMMRKNSLAISEWSLQNIRMCAERQHDILNNIADTVKGGGRLLYSTCTFAPEENEMQIAAFLREHPDFHLIPVNENVRLVTSDGLTDYGKEMKLCRRFYPHISPGEGQFMALMERDIQSETESEILYKSKKKEKNRRIDTKASAEEKIIRDFLAEVLTDEGLSEAENFRLVTDENGNYYLSPQISLPSSVRLPGVALGTVQKGRVIPHHNFFVSYGEFFKRKIILEPGDPETEKYLHGESIKTNEEKGFAAVMFGSAAVGGAKISNGEGKNYYPKGLRI